MQVASDTVSQHASAEENPAQRLLALLASSIWTPPERLSVSDWAAKYRVLASETSADAGPWRNEKVPYLVEPMNMFADPKVATITLMFAAQMGKSEAMQNMMFWAADVRGVSQIVMQPTEDDVKQYRHKRLEPSIRATPRMAEMLTGKRPITDTGAKLRGVYLDFAWSQSARTQKGKARGAAFCDEIDEYPDQSALDRVRNRSKTFSQPKFVATSTPSDADFGIDREYKKGDMRRLHVPCPNCGEFQVLTFKGLRWEGGANAKPDDVRANTWYECSACLHRIQERFKPWMVSRGVWVPKGFFPPPPWQEVENPQPVRAKPEPYPVPSHVSYQLGEQYSLFQVGRGGSWGSIAAEWVEHKGNPPPTFFTERLGEPYSSLGRTIDQHMLQKLCVLSKDGGYRKREIPPECRVLLAGIDVQHNRFYYLCRGFGAAGSKTWLIDEREIPFAAGAPMPQIEKFIREMKYAQERMSPDGVSKVMQPWRPAGWMVDTGDQTRDLYELVVGKFHPAQPVGAAAGGKVGVAYFPMVFACKGRGNSQSDADQPFTVKDIGEVGKDKIKLATAVPLINVNTTYYKNAIDKEWRGDPRLGLLTNERGEAIGSERSYLPGDTSKDYLDHLTSEWWKQVSEKTKGGWGTFAWVKKPGEQRNDFLDLEVYVRCLADRLNVSRLQRIQPAFNFVGNVVSADGAKSSATIPKRKLGIAMPTMGG